MFDAFASRDLVAPDVLPADLIDATPPGTFQLVKGGAPTPVAVLVEFDIEAG